MVDKSIFCNKNLNKKYEKFNSNYLNDSYNFEDYDNSKINYKNWFEEGINLFCFIDLNIEKMDNINNILKEFYVQENILYNEIKIRYETQKEKQKFLLNFIEVCFINIFDNIEPNLKNSIIKKINKINNFYNNNIDIINEEDLTNEKYMKKIEKEFNSNLIPYFLLKNGFQIIKNLKEDFLEKKKIFISQKNNNLIKINSKIENINFFKNYKFEGFFILFLNFLKQKNILKTKIIKDNIKILCKCFNLNDSYYIKNKDELFNENIIYEILFNSIDDIIKSKEKSNEMLNSYYNLIMNIDLFQNPNEVYINFLFFLNEIIPKNYNNFINILSEKINDYFSDNDNKMSNNYNNNNYYNNNYNNNYYNNNYNNNNN